MSNKTFITIQSACELLGRSKVWVHEQRKQGIFESREINGNGGKQFEICLQSLPAMAQIKYHNIDIAENKEAVQSKTEYDLQRYNEAPEYNRRKADKYRALLMATENLCGSALKKEIELWNANNPDMKTSYRSLLRIRTEYAERGIDALLGNYGKTKNRSISLEKLGEFGDAVYDYFKKVFLTQDQRTGEQCYMITRGFALDLYAKMNDGDVTDFNDVFPSCSTFIQKTYVELGEAPICLAREGFDAYNRKYNNFLNRNYSNVQSGEIWVSDHHQLDVLCKAPDGSLKRPWLTVWICMKSHKMLSYELALGTPNADRIINTFADGIAEYGIPKSIVIDNGKDYRANDFAGGRHFLKIGIDEKRARSLTGQLGVMVHFALPYNAQTKPVERIFRVYSEWFSKNMTGYVGRNTVLRPAEQLEKQIANKEIKEFSEVKNMLDFFIENIYNKSASNGKNHKGKSPDELFIEDRFSNEFIHEEALALLRTRISNSRTIARNGIRDNDFDDWYWGEWMEQYKGKKIYLRRSNKTWQKAYVFDAKTDEYLGMATLGSWSVPALAQTDVERNAVSEVLRRKNTHLRAQKAAIKPTNKPDSMEMLRQVALNNSLRIENEEESDIQVNTITRLTRMDEALEKEMEYRKTGTYDLSAIMPEEQITQKYKSWEE